MTNMTKCSGAEIFAKLLENPKFGAYPLKMLEAMKPFVEALPAILAKHWNKKVTLASLSQAQVAWLKYVMANGYVEKTIKTSGFDFLDIETITNMLTELLQMLQQFSTASYRKNYLRKWILPKIS